MCKVCTEAVHSVALLTRVTLGLGMCKVCTEALDMPEVCISCSVSFSAQNVSKNNPRLQMHETARPVYEMHINTRFPLGSTSEKMRANEGSEGTTTTTTTTSTSRSGGIKPKIRGGGRSWCLCLCGWWTSWVGRERVGGFSNRSKKVSKRHFPNISTGCTGGTYRQ